MKKSLLRSFLAAVICLFAGTTAQAQFTGGVEQYPTTDYSASPIEFTLSEVAAKLNTDAATLGAALQEYIEAEAPATSLFFVQQTDGTESSDPTADANGFWMDAEGNNVGYGDNSVFYASPSVDVEADVFAFYVGQMPNVMEAGQTAKGNIKLKYNESEVTFAISLSVIAKPVYDIPEPATLIEKDLNVVGEAAVVVEQFPRGGYDSDPVSVELTDVLSKLGISDAGVLVDALDKVLYSTWYNSGDVENGGGMKKDSLTNEFTAGAPGFWYRPIQNENGEETGEVSAAGWGDVDKFFAEAFSFNAETNVLSCNLGQYPGSCKAEEQWFANVYLIYGDKAYRVKITLKLNTPEQGTGLAAYTKMGEETVVVEEEPRDDFSTNAVHPDVDAIAAALGCEVSALGMVALDDNDNFANSTANNGGWWFSDAGTVVAWGNGAMFIEPATNGDYSTLNVGQHPNRAYQPGDETFTSIYFVNGTNYYQYTVDLKIVEPQQVEHNFESVATRTFALQSLLDNSYTAMDLITLKAEDLEALLGTATPTLYGQNNDSIAAVQGSIYSAKYSCDPKPGFWLAKDGTVSVWGAESPVGICWVDNSIFRFFQYPNANSIGDVFKTTLFLVNEETEKMITVNINLAFVESLEEKEIVGEQNIKLPVSFDGADVSIDLAPAAEALGVSVDDLLSPDNYYLRGLKSDGTYGEGDNCDNGLSFDLDGGFNAYGDILMNIANNGGNVVISVSSNDDVAEDFSVNGQFCFEIDNKQYVFYVRFVSPELYAGINNVTLSSKNAGKVFDLSGRQVAQPTRGLYIMNGKKVVVK
ncbi:MAG: DUF4859 domain-containing protein [Prevotella sp.]|nr:DUF4859 domain-containing protein [Prevotella sp.]